MGAHGCGPRGPALAGCGVALASQPVAVDEGGSTGIGATEVAVHCPERSVLCPLARPRCCLSCLVQSVAAGVLRHSRCGLAALAASQLVSPVLRTQPPPGGGTGSAAASSLGSYEQSSCEPLCTGFV